MIARRTSGYQLLCLLLLVFASWQNFGSYWRSNKIFLSAMDALLSDESAALKNAERALASLGDLCQSYWLLGLLYGSLDDIEQRDQAWETSLRCSPIYIRLVRANAPNDTSMAELAVHEHPEHADPWFWLAETISKDTPEKAASAYWQGLQLRPHDTMAWVDLGRLMTNLDPQVALGIYGEIESEPLIRNNPELSIELQFVLGSLLSKSQPESAIELYREGLQHKPHDGVRWYELGDLLAQREPQLAIEAYLQSCNYGDPGNHGCYGAGRVAEQQGDIQQAIQYYRLSDWEAALDRAKQLERTLP